jgi:uncharacterized membrane protein
MNQNEEIVIQEKPTPTSTIALIVLFIWNILGLLAYITSITCVPYGGTFTQNLIGILISIILGPFYWIYYVMTDSNYCGKGLTKQLQRKSIANTKSSIKKGKK